MFSIIVIDSTKLLLSSADAECRKSNMITFTRHIVHSSMLIRVFSTEVETMSQTNFLL